MTTEKTYTEAEVLYFMCEAFAMSGEGYNGEYPFEGSVEDITQDTDIIKRFKKILHPDMEMTKEEALMVVKSNIEFLQDLLSNDLLNNPSQREKTITTYNKNINLLNELQK